jgi:hypothetical protein
VNASYFNDLGECCGVKGREIASDEVEANRQKFDDAGGVLSII